ncbi:DNA/RNA non-specific endonuclease [Massilia sp. 9096]|uniref:DNA/RNA non-specific endonuclease n=1 Tax=Massilia sp. 9096 TaxID=1500894 RepID=UPI001EFB5698|nr:DNA/RNA non-specific endonuclease [Massilia sp. 9096]
MMFLKSQVRPLFTPLLLAALVALGGCHRDAAPGRHVRAHAPAVAASSQAAPQGAPEKQSCGDHFVGGDAPQFTNQKLAADTRELCFNVFTVMHSGITHTPLWSAEHLEAANVAAAQQLSRENSFHPETRLPAGERAELADYARSGFDRGHMAPNGDMPDRDSQYDSFSLANMVPQDGENNRHLWAAIEGAVRKLAKRDGELYVVTGPAFLGSEVKRVGKVLVPTHLYKLVWDPRRQAGAAWFVENTADAKANVVPIPELERIIGINLLPALSEQDKERVLDLPQVRANNR